MKKQKVLRFLSVLMSTLVIATSSGIPAMAQTESTDDGQIAVFAEESEKADALSEAEKSEEVDALAVEEESEGAGALSEAEEKEDAGGIDEAGEDNASEESSSEASAEADALLDDDGVTFEYKVVGKTAEITGYSHIGSASDDLGDLRIPEMIDGYTVTSIGP
ncbi:MAG: hypothetical protein K6G58_09020, partial [Lachnospiraceae bacterium]|nr:hypothetical protein [Lachnospiraceae bacterium]